MQTEPTFPLLAVLRLRMEIDGEGVTTLVAGKGCPLSCKYCINQEVLRRKPTQVSPQELFDRVKIDDLYFQATGGGLTFGGGEALLHTEFARAFRALCGSKWKLNAETALAVPPDTVRAAAQIFDSFIVDIKDTDAETYRAYTGGDGRLAMDNLRLLSSCVDASRICVRVPWIPGFNDRAAQQRSRETLAAMGIEQIELFDYVQKENTHPLPDGSACQKTCF